MKEGDRVVSDANGRVRFFPRLKVETWETRHPALFIPF